mmetsp:Transcript_78736/g.202851  ORF Transcript_78736/g.202851 Transcript_78736/m.202851 type:complete len:207 (+) Transcript_78736:297-917(+)
MDGLALNNVADGLQAARELHLAAAHANGALVLQLPVSPARNGVEVQVVALRPRADVPHTLSQRWASAGPSHEVARHVGNQRRTVHVLRALLQVHRPVIDQARSVAAAEVQNRWAAAILAITVRGHVDVRGDELRLATIHVGVAAHGAIGAERAERIAIGMAVGVVRETLHQVVVRHIREDTVALIRQHRGRLGHRRRQSHRRRAGH